MASENWRCRQLPGSVRPRRLREIRGRWPAVCRSRCGRRGTTPRSGEARRRRHPARVERAGPSPFVRRPRRKSRLAKRPHTVSIYCNRYSEPLSMALRSAAIQRHGFPAARTAAQPFRPGGKSSSRAGLSLQNFYLNDRLIAASAFGPGQSSASVSSFSGRAVVPSVSCSSSTSLSR